MSDDHWLVENFELEVTSLMGRVVGEGIYVAAVDNIGIER